MSALNLLATITDMEARLAEMRQQLALSFTPTYAPTPVHYPPGFAPRTRSARPASFAPSSFAPSSFAPSASSSFAPSASHSPSHVSPYSRGRISYPVNQMPTAVRLQHPQPYATHVHQSRPFEHRFETVALSAILQPQESVTLRISLRKDSADHADLVLLFDGEHLVVTACDLVPSLVGMSVVKPGEILYRFMEELHTAGHLKRMFTVAPWKLCVVVRDGAEVTLEELRRQYLAAKGGL